MTKKQMKTLRPNDLVAVNYVDETAPKIEVVENPVEGINGFVVFDSGRTQHLVDSDKMTKIGHFIERAITLSCLAFE